MDLPGVSRGRTGKRDPRGNQRQSPSYLASARLSIEEVLHLPHDVRVHGELHCRTTKTDVLQGAASDLRSSLVEVGVAPPEFRGDPRHAQQQVTRVEVTFSERIELQLFER